MTKFFVSHSTNDPEIVECFNEQFLRLALGIPKEQIYCTSVQGTLHIGEHFNDEILENLQNSEVVIFLITKKFLKSNYCLAELGAAWALGKKVYPLLLDQLDYHVLNSTPFHGRQSIKVSELSSINQLADEFFKMNWINPFHSAQLNSKATMLLNAIKDNENTEEMPSVEEFTQLKNQFEEAQNYINEQETKVVMLEKAIEDLKLTKDSKEVLKYELQGNSDKQTFENHISKIRSYLKKIDLIVISAIYHENFNKDEEFWISNPDKIKELSASQLLSVDYDDFEIKYNSEHPKLKKCVDLLLKLDDFLANSNKLIDSLEDEFEDVISLRNINFWNRFFNVRVII
ncbi:toll/interleukin-1 receptor domain-containing protein [Bacillus sp. 8A6]|uniref:toll/interleukin-1 receptor domain-containing protein n=1 Tax=unclassified Bacillus (in: firmicutes) TaxID=185979 RepID=UPI0015A1CA04|nr:toll/interleukin-1 receptor domain-containing protein [Bacillus sp. 8A6]NWF40730.1 hypothetical protein [Bacillus sp. 8A6]